MDSKNNFSSIDVTIEVNGKDVNLCVEYWIDCWDNWSYYIVETVNGLPSDIFTEITIDSIVEAIVEAIESNSVF